MNAADLMTADQYRVQAQLFLDRAQVYALLAISAQAAENRGDVPF